MNKPLPHFAKGDLLKADDLMAIRAAIIRQRLKAGSNSGIILSETPNGTQIRATPQSTPDGVFYAQSASVIAAATGVWPTLTCTFLTLDIYQRTGANIAKVDNAKVYNAMPDPTMANRRLILSLNPDGTYDVIGMSCHTG